MAAEADLIVSAKTQDAVESTVQARVSKPITLAGGKTLRLDAKVAWVHEWSPTSTAITEAFAAGGDPFSVAAARATGTRGWSAPG